MQAKANFWIEKDGQVVLSSWRIRLLEAVGETGSISAAASKMGVSYRRAWDKIHECEERLGVKLAAATDYIERFCHFIDGLNETVAARFQEYFAQD
jgi:molybdate transport system regulatory protein